MKTNLTGTVKFFNLEKAFGFITTDSDPKKDYFFHYSGQVDRDDILGTGAKVSFDIGENRRGECAVNVQRY